MEIQRVDVEDGEELLCIYAPYVNNTAVSFEYIVPSVQEFKERIRQIEKAALQKLRNNGESVGLEYYSEAM